MKFPMRIGLVIVALALIGAGKKQPVLTVRFHAETNGRDGSAFSIPVTLNYPPRQGFIEKVPTISEHDISAIFPFKAEDGTSGCAFKLNEHGTMALDTVSIEKRGQTLVALICGRQVVDMLIDKRISDGIITIPSGLAGMEIAALQKRFPTLGQPRR